MTVSSSTLRVTTRPRSTHDITREVAERVRESGVAAGLCHVFVRHTSASLMLCENADPAVRRDLERFLARLVPDGSRDWEHSSEGPDDMPAHVRSVLTGSDVTLPVADGRLDLGTWQGVYLYEHRHQGHARSVVVTILGDSA